MKPLALALLLASCSLWAQRNNVFQAEVRGSGNSGKCTIEVNVDDAVEISVRGTQGMMRTLNGQPGRWVRFQCNAPFPNDGMREFRFRGIDGRGTQTLVQDPRNNRGVAVVRIEDPKGGNHNYTFDLEWKGGYGVGGGGGGFFPGGPGGDGGGAGDIDQAIRRCEDRVRNQAERQYGVFNIRFDATPPGGRSQRGANDFINGTFEGIRNNNREYYDYTCRVNFNNGNVREVNITPRGGDPGGGGFFPGGGNSGGGGSWNQAQAIQGCRDAVANRLANDGYYDPNFQSTSVDNQPGRRDWVIGSVRARRNNRSDLFQFDCQVNFNNGNIRSVNVNRR